MLFLKDGYAIKPGGELVFIQSHKYLHNLIEMPVVGFLFLAGISLVVFGLYKALFRNSENGIWYTGPGVILTVFSLLLNAGFNNTSYYPSAFDLQSSLTIANSSSSYYTLKVMAFVSLLVPFVAAYMFYAWRAVSREKIDADELKENTHVY